MTELDSIVCECAWKSVKSSAYRLELSSPSIFPRGIFCVGSACQATKTDAQCIDRFALPMANDTLGPSVLLICTQPKCST